MISALSALFYFIAVLSDEEEDIDENFEDVDVSEDAILTMIFSKIERGNVQEVAKMMGLSKFLDFCADLHESTMSQYPDIDTERIRLRIDARFIGETAFKRDVNNAIAQGGCSSLDIRENSASWEFLWDFHSIERLIADISVSLYHRRGSCFCDFDILDLIRNRDDVDCFMGYIRKYYLDAAVEFGKAHDKAARCFREG